MASFNSVILCGHLTRDPELRYTPQGVPVCDFGLAVNRKYTRKSGEKVEEVAFVDVTAWSRQAEIAGEYLSKGRAVLVAGHLTQDRWQDEATGQKRSRLRVVAETLQFLGGAPKEGGAQASESSVEETGLSPAPGFPPPAPPGLAQEAGARED
jgi:single-strand DNA-binding protein